MKDNINMRLEDFSIIKKDSYLNNYYFASCPDGKAAIFNKAKEIIFYEEFKTKGELLLYKIENIIWKYTICIKYGLIPICWKTYYHKDSNLYALYSPKTDSYIVPFGEYTDFRPFDYCENTERFLITDGFNFYFLYDNYKKLDIEVNLHLKTKSKIIQFKDNIVIFKQQDSSEYTAAYLLKEEKFILHFEDEFNMIKIHYFGLIVTKREQMGIYSPSSGKPIIPLSNDTIKTFDKKDLRTNNLDKEEELEKLGIIKKSHIQNETLYTGVYTYPSNECIVPPNSFKSIKLLENKILLAEAYNLSYTVFSIEKRKPITPPSLGILLEENTIKAVKYIRFGGHESDTETEYIRGHNCGDYSIKRTKYIKAKYIYTICYDLYNLEGKIINSDIIEQIPSNSIWNPVNYLS